MRSSGGWVAVRRTRRKDHATPTVRSLHVPRSRRGVRLRLGALVHVGLALGSRRCSLRRTVGLGQLLSSRRCPALRPFKRRRRLQRLPSLPPPRRLPVAWTSRPRLRSSTGWRRAAKEARPRIASTAAVVCASLRRAAPGRTTSTSGILGGRGRAIHRRPSPEGPSARRGRTRSAAETWRARSRRSRMPRSSRRFRWSPRATSVRSTACRAILSRARAVGPSLALERPLRQGAFADRQPREGVEDGAARRARIRPRRAGHPRKREPVSLRYFRLQPDGSLAYLTQGRHRPRGQDLCRAPRPLRECRAPLSPSRGAERARADPPARELQPR